MAGWVELEAKSHLKHPCSLVWWDIFLVQWVAGCAMIRGVSVAVAGMMMMKRSDGDPEMV